MTTSISGQTPPPLNSLNRSDSTGVITSNALVPIELAQEIATKYHLAHPQLFSDSSEVREVLRSYVLDDSLGIPALYLITYKNDLGYLVISADWRHEPICAVVKAGTYPDNDAPSMLAEWFAATLENMEYIRYHDFDNTSRAMAAWGDLIDDLNITSGTLPIGFDCCEDCPNWPDCQFDPIGCGDATVNCGDPCGDDVNTIVGPLMTTEWGQRCTFNEQAEDKGCTNSACGSNTRALTGCVATAMAQLIRYHAPNSSHSYNYSSMPNTAGNTEVQRLMRDAGESVDMNYGCTVSGANSNKVPNALKDDFAFASADRSNYGAGDHQTIVSNLNNGRPVYLDGCRSKGGVFGLVKSNCHAWICDGYFRTRNNCHNYLRLYMNWGWQFGSNNGWFAFNNWNIPANNRNYQYANDFIYNIHL